MSIHIHKGDLVEFTDKFIRDYPPTDTSVIRYGVAMADYPANVPVLVKLADGKTVYAVHIHAYGWAGWMPEDLEEVWNELNPETYDIEEDV